MLGEQRAAIAVAWKRAPMQLSHLSLALSQTTLSTPKLGTICTSARRCLAKVTKWFPAHSSWSRNNASEARTAWTVGPQSVPNRVSGKNRGVFPDFDTPTRGTSRQSAYAHLYVKRIPIRPLTTFEFVMLYMNTTRTPVTVRSWFKR
jgi:hypothetical protein